MKLNLICAMSMTVAALTLIACDKKKAHEAAQAIGAEAKVTKNVTTLADKQSWDGECNLKPTALLAIVGIDELKADKVSFDFTLNEKVTRTTSVYSDTSCSQATFKKVESGSYDVGNDDLSKGTPIDIKLENLDVIPLTDDAASIAAKFKYCGHSDWKKGEKTSITTEATQGCLGAKGKRTAYDMVSVDGNKLTLGKNAEETSVDSRPKNVEGGTVYTSGSNK